MTPGDTRLRRGFAAGWPLLLIVIAFGLVALRAWRVDRHFGTYVGCPDCFVWPVVAADAWLVAALCALLLAAVNLRPAWLSRIAGVIAATGMAVYVTDLFIMHMFGIRLFFVDLAVYGLEPAIIWDQFAGRLGGGLAAGAALVAMAAVCLAPAWLPRRPRRGVNLALIVIGLCGGAMALVLPRPEYVNNWIYRNVFQANLDSTEAVDYSPERAQALRTAYAREVPTRCVKGPGDHPDVIVLILESWSAYQSPAFGGIFNWTPELDALAREHTRLTRLHAGGFSTNEGLVNILGGVRLWAPFSHFFESAQFGAAWGIEESLPAVFSRAGYRTAFMTTGPLSFMRKGEWMRDIGFDHVEGNEHPFYDDWPVVAFQGAADEALYQRALAWMGEAGSPWMLALETVTTHQPYIDPETGERDMEAAFRYADRQAARFHDELEQRGYFDAGNILVITSDHRSMDPVRAAERERFGQAAASRVPLIWIERDDTLPAEIDTVHTLSDLRPTLARRVTGEACMDRFAAGFFETPPHPGSCAFHLRGSERGIVDVLCASGAGRVRLEGDDTAFIEHRGLDAATREHILQTIAHERLEGLERRRRESAKGEDSS